MGQVHPEGAAEGYPCCNTGKSKEQSAEAIVLWPSGSSPPISLKDLGGTEHTAKVKGC